MSCQWSTLEDNTKLENLLAIRGLYQNMGGRGNSTHSETEMLVLDLQLRGLTRYWTQACVGSGRCHCFYTYNIITMLQRVRNHINKSIKVELSNTAFDAQFSIIVPQTSKQNIVMDYNWDEGETMKICLVPKLSLKARWVLLSHAYNPEIDLLLRITVRSLETPSSTDSHTTHTH